MGFIPRRSKTKKLKPKTRKPKAKPTTALVKQIVKQAIDKNVEDKRVAFYSSGQNADIIDGLLANAAFNAQNQLIANNLTDIKRLIPYCVLGSDSHQRIGSEIRPKRIVINGNVAINLANNTSAYIRKECFVVIYVLQHQIFHSYQSLIGGAATPTFGNNFNQLLETGESTLKGFQGLYIDSTLPVAKQFYKLITKKIVKLRYQGYDNFSPTGNTASVANAHDYRANFQLTLDQKQLPAKFKYPEPTVTGVTTGLNDPTNSSIFMCMGFYEYDGFQNLSAISSIQQQYTSMMYYEDA